MATDEVRSLLIRVNATTELMRSSLIQAERALGDFDRTAGKVTERVGANFRGLGRQAQALKDALDPVAAAQRRYTEEVQRADRMYKAGLISMKDFAGAHGLAKQRLDETRAALAQNGQQMMVLTNRAGAQRQGFQQLSYQLGDISTMYAMGARPMQIFASQSGQVLQAIQLAMGGTSRFASFLAGPWGILITAGVVALTPLIGQLFETEKALDNVGDAARDAMAKVRDAISQTSNISDAATKNTEKLVLAMAARGKANQNIARTKADIAALSGTWGAGDAVGPLYDRLAQYEKDRAGAQARVSSAQNALSDLRDVPSIISMQQRNRARLDGGYSRGSSIRGGGSGVGGGGRYRSGSGGGGGRSGESFDPASLARDTAATLINMTAEFEQRMSDVRDGDLKDQLEIAGRIHDNAVEFATIEAEQRRRMGEQQIDFLSRLYQNGFQNGTKAIWKDFEQIGLSVISQLLARFTLAKATGGGFNFGSALAATFGSILGFAEGGRPPVGRASIVGERGPELFVPDAVGTVVPNGGFGGGGGVSVVINAPGATAETVAMMRKVIAESAPMIISAAQARTTRSLTRPRI